MAQAARADGEMAYRVTLSPCHLVTLSLLLVAGCDLPGKPDPADRPVPENRVMSFDVLFAQNCAGCHGAEGKLGPAPPLNDPLFRAIVPERVVIDVVSRGRQGTLMPAFDREDGGNLTAAQVQVLVNEIKGVPYRVVEKRPGDAATVEVVRDPQGTRPVWGAPGPPPKGAPPYEAKGGNADSGGKVFARACAVCHGDEGGGDKGDKTSLKIHDPVFVALLSDQVLRRFAITGRPDLGMPDYAGPRPDQPGFKPLSAEEVTDLAAYLASWKKEGSAAGKSAGEGGKGQGAGRRP